MFVRVFAVVLLMLFTRCTHLKLIILTRFTVIINVKSVACFSLGLDLEIAQSRSWSQLR